MSDILDKPSFVSVIVPVYNDAKRLEVCLAALQHQSYPESCYEVIVVDNGSNESIKPIIDRFPQAGVAFEGRRGSYSARNRGISLAKGEVIAFTDSDCIPAFEWIEKGVENLSRTDNCGAVGGKVTSLFAKQGRPTAVELFDSLFFFQQKVYIDYYRFSVTANLFTLKRIFDHVGFFNDSVMSGGDREWGNRVFLAGYCIKYSDEVEVYHPARRSFAELFKKVIRIVGGLYELERTNSPIFLPVSTNFLRRILPPRARMSYVWSSGRVRGTGKRIRVVLLLLLLQYLAVGERMRLRLRDARLRMQGVW